MPEVILPPEVKLRHHIRTTIEKGLAQIKDDQINLASYSARVNLTKMLTDRLIDKLVPKDAS